MVNVEPQDAPQHAETMASLSAWHLAEKTRLARLISSVKTSKERSAARAAQAALDVEYRKRLKDLRGQHY
jgi:hypothetical protein